MQDLNDLSPLLQNPKIMEALQQMMQNNQKSEMENTKEDVPMENSIKIVLTGDMSVGKTCISERFVREKYTEQGTTTGVSYFQKRIN